MALHDEESPRPRMLNLLIGVTLATIIIALWYLLDYYLRDSNDEVTWYPPQQGCVLLDDSCRASLGLDGVLTFSLEETLEDSGPLVFRAQISGPDPQAVYVEFIGRDVNVRSPRLRLAPEGNNVFLGHADLGLCSRHVSAWRAQVSVVGDDGLRGSWFDFDTTRLIEALDRRQVARGCLWRETPTPT